jgi:hypothetical protein
MADAVLGARLGAAAAPRRPSAEAPAPPATLAAGARDAVLGRYRSDELLAAVWEVVAGDSANQLVVRRTRAEPQQLTARSSVEFAARGGAVVLLFDPPVRGRSPGFRLNGSRVTGVRFERVVP